MAWFEGFHLVMFDFDGVLVDSERAHYEAYRAMCARRNVNLGWDFSTFCRHAHYSSTELERAFYADYPELRSYEWRILYEEKTEALLEIYRRGEVGLQPGVVEILEELAKANVMRCVVTHSSQKLVMLLREQHPVLNTIPFWITREDYVRAKPAPDSYCSAIERFLSPGGKAIGFEDTPRGIAALMGSGATAVLVPQCEYPEIPTLLTQGVFCIPSFEEAKLLKKN